MEMSSPGFCPSATPSIAALAAGWPWESTAGESDSSYSTLFSGGCPKSLSASVPEAAQGTSRLIPTRQHSGLDESFLLPAAFSIDTA